jgi:hypothetical protein
LKDATRPEHLNRDSNLDLSALGVDDEDQDLFLKTLEGLQGKAGNKAMMQTLGWDKERYEAVKTALIDQGLITTARGRGGSVCLV